MTKSVLKAVKHNFKHSVFSYIPNTAESAFLGLVKGIDRELNKSKTKEIQKLLKNGGATPSKIETILSQSMRVEKIVVKSYKPTAL